MNERMHWHWPVLLATIWLIGCDAPHGARSSNQAPPAAASCAACHGPAGISSLDVYPNLAGQKETYLLNQLRAYRAGDRPNPMMQSVLMALEDDTLQALAAYYASLPPCAADKP